MESEDRLETARKGRGTKGLVGLPQTAADILEKYLRYVGLPIRTLIPKWPHEKGAYKTSGSEKQQGCCLPWRDS